MKANIVFDHLQRLYELQTNMTQEQTKAMYGAFRYAATIEDFKSVATIDHAWTAMSGSDTITKALEQIPANYQTNVLAELEQMVRFCSQHMDREGWANCRDKYVRQLDRMQSRMPNI